MKPKKRKIKTAKVLQELNITLPSCWGELTAAQVSRVAFYLSQGLDRTEYLVRLTAELADLKPRGYIVTESGDIVYKFYNRNQGNLLLTSEAVAAIADSLRWTMEQVKPMCAPLLDGYSTPDDALYGLTMEQYLTADSAFSAYTRSQDPEALRMMVASLYTRKGFDPNTLPSEAQRMRHLPSWQLQAVFLWFSGAKQILTEKFPFVFSTDSDPDDAPLQGDEMMLGLLSSLNEGRVVDNDKLRSMDIYEIFYELNRRIKTAKESRNHV